MLTLFCTAFRQLAQRGNLFPVYPMGMADLEGCVLAFFKVTHRNAHAPLRASIPGGKKWAALWNLLAYQSSPVAP